MNDLRKWGQAALTRAARQMAQVALAMLPAAAVVTEIDWITVAGTALCAGVASILMSVVVLPEAVGESTSFLSATFWRTIRTMAATAAGLIPAGVIITDIDWIHLVGVVLFAGILCILTAIMTDLPEAEGEDKLN